MKTIRSKISYALSFLAIGVTIILTSTAVAPPAQAEPPCTRYTLPMPSDGTVLDNETKLTWQQNVDATERTWGGAQAYCESLPLPGGKWRLPTVFELQTIVDETKASPAIDAVAFPATPAQDFWASTLFAEDPTGAWHVDFTAGSSFIDAKTRMYLVRCVR